MPRPTRRKPRRHMPWPVSIEIIEHHIVWADAPTHDAAVRAVADDPAAWLHNAGTPLHHLILIAEPHDEDTETALTNLDKE